MKNSSDSLGFALKLIVTGFDNSVAGSQTVTVKYGQYSDTMEVKVV